MEHSETHLEQLRNLFASERLAVLSTQKEGRPYASLVAFYATESLDRLIFLTPDTTRKFGNLTASPKVALLIHNSRNQAEDIYTAVAVTALGAAAVVRGDARDGLMEAFLERHPNMAAFADEPSTAMISVAVDTYMLVSQFQDVTEIRMAP